MAITNIRNYATLCAVDRIAPRNGWNRKLLSAVAFPISMKTALEVGTKYGKFAISWDKSQRSICYVPNQDTKTSWYILSTLIAYRLRRIKKCNINVFIWLKGNQINCEKNCAFSVFLTEKARHREKELSYMSWGVIFFDFLKRSTPTSKDVRKRKFRKKICFMIPMDFSEFLYKVLKMHIFSVLVFNTLTPKKH